MLEDSRPSKDVLNPEKGEKTRKAMPPLCAVLAGGLEPAVQVGAL